MTIPQPPENIINSCKKLGDVKLIDSSTIGMVKTYFEWAEFSSTKAGIKLHTKFDLGKGIPELIVVSNAKSHDRAMMDDLITENDCIYVFDKGYIDYKKFIGHSFNAVMMQIITALITFIVIRLIQDISNLSSAIRLANKFNRSFSTSLS